MFVMRIPNCGIVLGVLEVVAARFFLPEYTPEEEHIEPKGVATALVEVRQCNGEEMTPLVIDDKVISTLRQFAEDNPIPIEESMRIMRGEAPAPGEREGYSVHLPPCWKLVFTHSQYPNAKKSGSIWVKCMSMSLDRPGRVPNPAAIQILCEQLGFPSLDKCKVTLEDEIVEVICALGEVST
jgi:hypothetical protein